MKILMRFFPLMHGLMAVLFACASIMLVVISARIGFTAVSNGWDAGAAQSVIEAIGLLAAAVVALQVAETIAEEEVIRGADISAPTRVRRYLSRFFVVIIVALAVEGLVATFKALHEDSAHLIYASALLCSTALLLSGWGLFVFLNRAAEELEPDAMADAKAEDRAVTT
jgi:hypothetical protein